MTLRAAVIGAGFGARIVAEVYRETGMTVAVVSPRDTDGVRAAIADPVDLVSIHSPPFLHAEQVGLALDAGRNVLCDKPFGRSAEEARAMLAAAQARGVLHFVNFEFRHDPAYAALTAMIHGGAIGPLRHLHWIAYNAASRTPLRRHGWLFDRGQAGGWIGAFGSHAIDTIRCIGGEITRAHTETRIDIKMRPDAVGTMQASTAEDAFTTTFRLADGATATLDTAFAAPVNLAPRITVIGRDGVLEMVGTTHITLHRPDAPPVITEFPAFIGDPHLPAMRPWAALIHQALVTGRQIGPSFADGLACAEVMDMMRGSAAQVE